jgi:hypothetical protein
MVGGVKAKRRFRAELLATIDEAKGLRIRAGVWAVVVEGRVFVRSWSLKPRSWYRTFLKEPRGAVQVGGREIPVRAIQTKGERLKDAVSRAYLAKYKTAGSLKYAQDLGRPKSRATTTELVPLD